MYVTCAANTLLIIVTLLSVKLLLSQFALSISQSRTCRLRSRMIEYSSRVQLPLATAKDTVLRRDCDEDQSAAVAAIVLYRIFVFATKGSTRFDGQENLLHKSNENTIKAENDKHRNYDNEVIRINRVLIYFRDINMAMATSSATTVDEAPQEDCIWMELRLLQSIVVQTRLGQTVLKLVDNFLWIVEKCAEWSLPRQEISRDENRKDSAKPELVRPLPWLLFLPSLVMLRVIRMTVNIGACILGYSTITPSGMVKFVQISRRYLNAAMNKGAKERHEIKDKKSSMNEAKKALIRSIRLTLSSLSCLDTSKPSLSPPPTKIYVSSILDPDPVTTTSEEKSVTESVDSTAKSKDSMSESEEEKEEQKETLKEKIDRLALESSENDEDFDPAKCSFSDDASSNEDSDENSDDSNVSSSEVRDILEDALINKELHIKLKEQLELLLDAERNASAPASKQEFVEPVCGKRSSAKESRDKVAERLATSQRIDSPECYTPDRSSQEGDPTFYSPISSDSDAPKELPSVLIAEQCVSRRILKTNEFINGEARFIPASTISESKSPGRTNNGTMMEKRSTNVSKYHKGKRTSHGNRKKK